MTIDKGDWHWEDTAKEYRRRMGIPDNAVLTEEQAEEVWAYAGNHIGLFIQWIIENGFEGQDADEERAERIRKGEMLGTEYFINSCDCKFLDEDVSEEILPFVLYYYNESKLYLDDYCECCLDKENKPCYGVISDREDYIRLKARIDKAYREYSASH